MFYRSLAASALALMLVACGGGGSSSPQSSGNGSTSGGTATPAPTAPTYTRFEDLTGVQDFATICSAIDFNDRMPRLVSLDEGFTFRLEPGTNESWTIAGPSPDGELNQLFVRDANTFEVPNVFISYADLAPSGGTGANPRLPAGFDILTPQWPVGTPEYLRAATFFPSSLDPNFAIPQYECVFGVPTLIDDRPSNDPVTFTTEFAVTGSLTVDEIQGNFFPSFQLFPSTFTATVDPATGQVDFTLELKGTQTFLLDVATGISPEPTDIVDFGTYRGTVMLDEQQRAFAGQLTKENGINLNSVFTGWFFGPQGAEIGIAVSGTEQRIDGVNLTYAFTVTAPTNQ